MNERIRHLLVSIFLVFTTSSALGDPSFGVPSHGGGDRTLYGTANSASPLQYDTDGVAGLSLAVCVPFGETAIIEAKNGEWLGTLTMDPDVTMPLAANATGGCYIADAENTATSGPGSCIAVAQRKYVEVKFSDVYSLPGARSTVCSSPVRRPFNRTVWPPCFDNDDCTAAGAGTCVTGTTLTQAELKERSCAYLLGQVDTANTVVTVAAARRPGA